ncbi:hypothetical protein GBF38_020304 [Nibea albiflora]|uniref:Uncharacterized protein n=1 Tax=Nibea albiflora TaxID=240163 RepID=A0ACB7FE07_NIBAL|nr:hypothetical protein GBF38_020304 [Nibea albiflora]
MAYYENRIKKMLPKTYLREYVSHEICLALTHFKNLEPIVDTYVYNDGTTKDLMCLSGTIPIMFNGGLQFHTQTEGLSKTDGSSYQYLAGEDGQPLHQANETNC